MYQLNCITPAAASQGFALHKPIFQTKTAHSFARSHGLFITYYDAISLTFKTATVMSSRRPTRFSAASPSAAASASIGDGSG